MSIGENIARYRKAKNLTQEQLGELLGVTNQAVSKWESGVSMPDVMLLPKISNALGRRDVARSGRRTRFVDGGAD